MKTLTYAPEAWKYLNGFFCVYKPPNLSSNFVRRTMRFNLARDLNELEKRKTKDLVLLKGSMSSEQPFSVEVSPNYADHELVSGSHYQEQDIKLKSIGSYSYYTSGLLLYAINQGCKTLHVNGDGTFLRKYEVKGKFGLATQNFMSDGKVVERTTYSHIRQAAIDRLLASIQFSYQALSYKFSGIDIKSQEGYELASKGLVRPIEKTKPLIYSLKCTEFSLPRFTLEIHCINENESFLAELVHQLGIYLKSTAVCTGLRRTQFGHLTLDAALLRKHWTLENVITNITLCQKILNRDGCAPLVPQLEVLKSSQLNEIFENMQDEVREDVL